MSEIVGQNDNRRFIEEFGQDILDAMTTHLNLRKQVHEEVEMISKYPLDKYGFTNSGVFLIQGTTLVEFESYIDGEYNECIDIVGYSHTDMYTSISLKWKREIKINRLIKKN